MARPQSNNQSGVRSPGEGREVREKRVASPAKTRSLQVRLALLVVLITTPALLLVGFLSLYAADRAVVRVLDDRGYRTAEWLDDSFGPFDLRGDLGPVHREIERLTRVRSGVREVFLFAWDGESKSLVSVAARAKVVAFAPSHNDLMAAHDDKVHLRRQEHGWDVSAPVHRNGKVVGVVRADIALPDDGDDLLAEARIYLAIAALGALGLTGVALVLALDRAIGRQVEELVGVMELARQGDLNVEVPVTHLDEFGWLGENFNRMLRKLREKDESLARWNAELEQKVAAATEELAKKNDELARANHRLFEAQRALGNSERLASLGQLASQIAHEIGTPLNSIYGHIQLLAADEIPDGAKKRVAIVESQVERLTKIIENVLRTLRLPEAQLEECEVNPILAGVAAFMQPVAESRKIRLELDLAASLPLIYVDPRQLEQVLLNLITNSIDAMPEGGKLRLESAALELADASALSTSSSGEGKPLAKDQGDRREHRGDDEQVLLRVRDTGVGVAPENLHRIFEPFFTTKAKGSGTGLGLPICQQILRTFRGSVGVESEGTGKGSCFTVKLPALRRTTTAAAAPFPDPAAPIATDSAALSDSKLDSSDTRTFDSSASLSTESARLAKGGGA